MANSVTVGLVGLSEFRIALDQWGEDVRRAFEQEIRTEAPALKADLEAAAPIAADAHHGHPPGTLRRGIRVSIDTDAQSLSLRARSTAQHTHLVEYGTVKMAAQPFFVPTVIRARRTFNARAKELLAQPAPGLGPGRPTVVESGGSGTGI